jgi:ketosteroid isomerase-like protein
MAEETRNVALLREAYRLWHETKGGSVDHWMDLFADSLEFGSIAQSVQPASRYMTMHENKSGLREYFRGIGRDWEMIEFRPEHFVAQGDRVVMLGRCSWKFKKTGITVWSPKADSFRFADGKIIEFFEYFDTALMKAAMG